MHKTLLTSAVFAALLTLSSCSQSTETKTEIKPSKSPEVLIPSESSAPENLVFWKVAYDEVDDFGEKMFGVQTYSETGVGPSRDTTVGPFLQFIAVCVNSGKFYFTVASFKDRNLEIIGSVESFYIRFDEEEPKKVPVFINGNRVIHLENSKKYVAKMRQASTFSVKFTNNDDATYRGTFNVGGLDKFLLRFDAAGCSL